MERNSKTAKTRYSDIELAEFEILINKKLESARKELEFYVKQLSNSADDPDQKAKGLDGDLGTAENERLTTHAARLRKHIQHLENANLRIKNKVYGICRVTGKLIAKERLLAVPHATLSIEAKRQPSTTNINDRTSSPPLSSKIPKTKPLQRLEIKVNKDFDSFSDKELFDLLSEIKKTIPLEGPLRYLSKRKGSVIIELEMPHDEAEKLLMAIKNGKLMSLGIHDAKLMGFNKKVDLVKNNKVENGDIELIKSELKRCIENDDLKEALGKLKNCIRQNSCYYDELINISSRINRISKDQRNGLMKSTDKNSELNNITMNFLQIINEVKANDLKFNPFN